MYSNAQVAALHDVVDCWVEWVEGTAEAMTWRKELALATMTGHAFQRLVTDEEVLASLRAVRCALVPTWRSSRRCWPPKPTW